MTLAAGACLTKDALTLLVWGQATADHADGAMRHIDLCDACREVFERLARASIPSAALPRSASAWPAGSGPAGDAAWSPPPEIDEFRVLRRLGRGAMGDVWLARDTLLERDVALKFAAAAATDEARLRFRVEARAVARLQHPNILAVHHAGELQDRPFLVTELLHGNSLDGVDTLPPDRVIGIGADIARALAAAHAAGVIHRDVKPANAFLCDDGVAKLLDFGLAQLRDAAPTGEAQDRLPAAGLADGVTGAPESTQVVTHGEGIAGTPAYMAPETWRGEVATRPTDVYSLGALLYTLLAGRPPYGGNSVQQLRWSVLAGQLPDLATAAPEAPAAAVSLVRRCLHLSPEARPTAEEVCHALQAMLDSAMGAGVDEVPPDPGASPYRGLLTFGFEQRGLFFGREVETATVLTELRGAPFVLVVGPSGAGKSSLVRAGVLPHVLRGALGAGPWREATMVPGESPVVRLAHALAPILDVPEEDIATRVTASPDWAAQRIAERAGPEGILLFVDQFEEAWTLAGAPQRATLFDALAAMSRGGSRVRVVATLRSDLLSKLKDLGELRAQALRAPVVLGAMSSDGLRRAIVEPAQRRGVEVEPQLVDRLLDVARGASGMLPLLEFALGTLWERRDRSTGRITAADLDALGGLEGALAAHADAVFAGLTPQLRAEARRLLLALVTLDGTRARREEHDLMAGSPAARSALDALVGARLVVASAGEDATAYEVAHEVLLSGWPTLRGWLAEEAAVRELLERTRRAAAEWERLGRGGHALFGERPLGELDVLQGHALPSKIGAFVEASRTAVRRAQVRRVVLALAIPLVLVSAGAAGWAVSRARDRALLAHAVAEARALDTNAEETGAAAKKARAEAMSIFEKDDLGPAEALWKQTLALEEQVDRQRLDVGAALDRAFALDARDAEVRALYADVSLARLLAAERLHKVALLHELRTRLDVYDDGSRTDRLHAPAHVHVDTEPESATLTIARYRADGGGKLVESDRAPLAAGSTRELEPGSYLILAEARGRYTTRYPFVVRRAEERALRIVLPYATDVPEGMIYVPAGRFLYGSDDDEGVRRFLTHQPIHDVELGAFLIARTEVTNADYLEYLSTLPEVQRRDRLRYRLTLLKDGRVAWRFRGQTLTVGERYCSGAEPCVDWSRLPVEAASRLDGEQFAAWLARSGRLPGARLCTDREWERAARGADDRRYPSGDGDLGPADACTLATYGGDAVRAGPCAVGAHPACRSPFGVDDMIGNVAEWTSNPADIRQPKQAILRGVGWDGAGMFLYISNRGFATESDRVAGIGLRVCADAR